ncbi:hypothetical protein DRN97_06520 [Methanosarcinales archaeon]|nr:MAG: hypothetical protein DRN97_06520 [Methanosarcinales archaeon]
MIEGKMNNNERIAKYKECQEPAVKTAGLRAPGLATQVLNSLSQGGQPPSGYVTGGYSPRGASPAPGSEGRSTPAGEGSRTGADTPPADIGEGTLSAPREQTPDGRAGLSPAHSPREAEKKRGGERANSSHQAGVSASPVSYEVLEVDQYSEDALFARIRDTTFGEEFLVQAFLEDGKWRAKYEEEEDTGLSLDLWNPDIDKAIQKAVEQIVVKEVSEE